MKKIETSVTINAPVEKVWEILMAFENYADWNPFISRVEGSPVEGSNLKNTMHLEGMKPQVFKPVILKVRQDREFRWLGSMFFKGIFDGEHYFLLEKDGEGRTKVIHGENFSGILSGLVMRMIGEKTQTGFKAMNLALKNRVEGN